MSLIETETPQKPKQYSERQDHGSAAGRKGHELYTVGNGARVNADWAEQVGRHKQAQNEQVIFANELLDDKDEKVVPLTEAELEEAADKLLGERGVAWSTDRSRVQYEDDEEDDPDFIDYENDTFATEAELGLKSKHEIKKAMAHRATLDVEYEDDADDYHVPIRIKNRL